MASYFVEHSNSKSFYNMAWIAFILSVIAMVIGLGYLKASFEMKGFLAVSYLFSTMACFTVAKVVRDKFEAERVTNKVEQAKTERLLNEHGH